MFSLLNDLWSRSVTTLQRKYWKRKKEVFLCKLKDTMRRTKLPQIDVTGRHTVGEAKNEKLRATPWHHREQRSHKLFPRER